MIEDKRFIEDFSLGEFIRFYGDLLECNAKFSAFEYRVLKTTCSLLILENKDQTIARNVDTSIRTVTSLLKNGAACDFNIVIRPILRNIEPTQNALNLAWEARNTADEFESDDRRIKGYLEYYKTLYESCAARVLAAPIASLVSLKKLPSGSSRLNIDGKVNLSVILRWTPLSRQKLKGNKQ